ncbi:hypothetical protein [Leptolyngbya sp. NIES-2104]|uniref:hypothetical protein n=1 Tax=Leptolyngbya sp. NIES-2104 TaxID=1552121 RepID=UPI0006ECC710|nr:hypothetical protein [Leptolyngbya sp. NIES-2104]GAQ00202.1 hypothetical protein NIES2104_67670 [Leptolyngbya sp. NIES-2104]
MSLSSASRQLHTLLKQAQEMDGQRSIQTIWAEVLEANPSDYAEVCQKVGQLFVLFDDVEQEIRSLKVTDTDVYLVPLNNLRLSLMSHPILGGVWESVRGDFRQNLDLLAACADIVESQNRGVHELSSEELKDLRQKIGELQNEILKSDIDAEIKAFLINELRKIEASLLNYQIRGSIGVARVSEEVAGRILFSGWQGAGTAAQEIVGKAFNYVLTLDKAVRIGGSIHKLVEGLKDYLPLLPPS